MSLDIHICFKEPKLVNYRHYTSACGSTIELLPHDDTEREEMQISMNITHNMGNMAKHVPITFELEEEMYSDTLYQYVWRGDEVSKYVCNTDVMSNVLISGIQYMIGNRNKLLQYNPENGWGNYDDFLDWLITYKRNCDENPNCTIEISR